MKKLNKYLLFILVTVAAPLSLFAQLGPGDPCYDPEVYCPVDGGLALLIGTGILLGIRQAKQLKG